jgi:hypothetical protein
MTKTKKARADDATEGPGLARLRRAKNAEQIRSAVLDDRRTARAKARAKIAAVPAFLGGASAPQQAAHSAPSAVPALEARPDAECPPAPAPAARQRAIYAPTPVPTPAEAMTGMSRANAALYMAAARGEMPAPPDFSKRSCAPDRRRLAPLVDLAAGGDIDALRRFGCPIYYTAGVECDRHRHRAILALEHRQRAAL